MRCRRAFVRLHAAMFARLLQPNGKPLWPFFVRRSTAKVETALQYLKENPAFASDTVRKDLLDKIKSLAPDQIRTDNPNGWPAIPLHDMSRNTVWEGFTSLALEIKRRTEHVRE